MPDQGDVQTAGNGSVHWRVRLKHKGGNGRRILKRVAGDSARLDGGLRTLKGKTGLYFRVRMRFPDRETALTELADALTKLRERKDGAAFATDRVRAIYRKRANTDLPWEVKVAW